MPAIAITQMGSDGKTIDFFIFVQHVFCGGQAPSFEYGAFSGPGEGHRSRRRQRMSIYPLGFISNLLVLCGYTFQIHSMSPPRFRPLFASNL